MIIARLHDPPNRILDSRHHRSQTSPIRHFFHLDRAALNDIADRLKDEEAKGMHYYHESVNTVGGTA